MRCLSASLLVIFSGAALGADPSCASGDPWVLPPSKPNNLGQQYLLIGLPQAARIRVCNCTPPGKGDSYVMLNAYRAEGAQAAAARQRAIPQDNPPNSKLPNSNLSSRIYAGSCLDAGGTEVYVTNPSETAPAAGTYTPR